MSSSNILFKTYIGIAGRFEIISSWKNINATIIGNSYYLLLTKAAFNQKYSNIVKHYYNLKYNLLFYSNRF